MLLYDAISIYLFLMILAVMYWAANIRSFNSSGYTRTATLLGVVICIYIYGYTMELNAGDPSAILFWNRFEYLGIPFVSALWLTVGLIYTGHFTRNRAVLIPLIYLVPVVTLVLRMTNEAHHLYFASYTMRWQLGKLVLTRVYGPWMYVQSVHSMSMILITLTLFIREFMRAEDKTPGKFRLIVAASVVAVGGLVLGYLRPDGFVLDYMALSLPLACLLVILAIVRFDFMEIKALARSKSFESNKDALLLIGRHSRIIDYNKKARSLFAKVGVRLSNGELGRVFANAPDLLSGLLGEENVVVRLPVDGAERHFEITTTWVDEHSHAHVCIKTLNDVTEAFEFNRSLQRQAMMDELSGLYNRRAFVQMGTEAIARAVQEGQTVHLLMLDLDFFKSINDQYGHQVGDQMIAFMGHALKAAFTADGMAARLGGEEFGMLLTGQSDARVQERAKRFVSEVAGHRHYAQERAFQLTVSIGVASLPSPDRGLYDLMLLADKALYRAKDAGRNRVVWYTDTGKPDEPESAPLPKE